MFAFAKNSERPALYTNPRGLTCLSDYDTVQPIIQYGPAAYERLIT